MQAKILDLDDVKAQLALTEADYLALKHEVKCFCAELYAMQLKMIDLNKIHAELTLKLKTLATQAHLLQAELCELEVEADSLISAGPTYSESSSLLKAHRLDSVHHSRQQQLRLTINKIKIALLDNQVAHKATNEAILELQSQKACFHLKEAVKERNARLFALQTLSYKVTALKLQLEGKASVAEPSGSALLLHTDHTSLCPVCEAILDVAKEA